jgi:hypothetical protein
MQKCNKGVRNQNNWEMNVPASTEEHDGKHLASSCADVNYGYYAYR